MLAQDNFQILEAVEKLSSSEFRDLKSGMKLLIDNVLILAIEVHKDSLLICTNDKAEDELDKFSTVLNIQ